MTAGPSASAPRWEGADATLPTLAFGDYLVTLDETRRARRPAPTASWSDPHRAARHTASHSPCDPVWCALSMLFSDWDRSGRRDLRVIERPPLLHATARSSYGGSGPASRRGSTRATTAGPAAALGHGHRQPGPDRRRLSRGLPDEPGRQQAADPRRRSRSAVFEDIALRRGATAHRPFTGGESMPSTAWHPAFDDVNNDGFTDLYVTQGQRRGADRLRDEGPEQPPDRPARRHVRRGRRWRLASSTSAVRAGPRSSTSTPTACSTS